MSEDRVAAIHRFVAGILAERAAAGLADASVLGVGWATVELDRAQAEFGGDFEAAADDLILNAWCRIAGVAVAGRAVVGPAADVGPRLVLMEPSTEGRLAAMLARHGEGPLIVWLEAGLANAVQRPLSRLSPGPFGPERLVLGGPFWGPHMLLVEAWPGTIPP